MVCESLEEELRATERGRWTEDERQEQSQDYTEGVRVKKSSKRGDKGQIWKGQAGAMLEARDRPDRSRGRRGRPPPQQQEEARGHRALEGHRPSLTQRISQWRAHPSFLERGRTRGDGVRRPRRVQSGLREVHA